MSTESNDVEIHEEEEIHDATYQPPPQKTIEEILEADKEDESLRRYKEALLGTTQVDKIIVDESDPRQVIVKNLALVVEGRDDMEIDLTGDLSQLKKKVYIIKEGIQYRVRIGFIVQREIVHGLKYVQKTYAMGVPIDKNIYMVGSYPPKKEMQYYVTSPEKAPSGLLARGTYSVSSLFTDDDKNIHLKWDWTFAIKKDWE